MGLYSDGKVYGVRWNRNGRLDSDEGGNQHKIGTDDEAYRKVFLEEMTSEQIQQVRNDFLRLVPVEERSKYDYYIYTKWSNSMGETVSDFFFQWFELCRISYFLDFLDEKPIYF